MKTGYTDILFEMSHTLCKVLLEQEPDIAQKVHELDGEVNKILRRLGFYVVSLVLAELGSRATKEAKATDLTTHRSGRIKYSSLFGVVEMLSPYVWNKNTGRGARPVKEQLGIEHGTVRLQYNEQCLILALKNLLGKQLNALRSITDGALTEPRCAEK